MHSSLLAHKRLQDFLYTLEIQIYCKIIKKQTMATLMHNYYLPIVIISTILSVQYERVL